MIFRSTLISSFLLLSAVGASAKVVLYHFNLTVGDAAPDGISREVYFVNGQTPGPTIVATVGDEVSVHIHNNLDVDTTVHFHGIEQRGTPWSDGVPGVTQRPIPKHEGVFISNWTATEHGTYWYHAHSQEVYSDGVRGIITILPSQDDLDNGPWSHISSNPVDIASMKSAHMNAQPLMLSDWTHWTSTEGLQRRNQTGREQICLDSILVNGVGRVLCPSRETFASLGHPDINAKGCLIDGSSNSTNVPDLFNSNICTNTSTPFATVSITPESLWASFAIVNMGASWSFKVSIDEHEMWVYAADGQFHLPQRVDVLEVASGERYQVLVRLLDPSDLDCLGQLEYTIRVASAETAVQYISGFAVLSYLPALAQGSSTLPPASNPALDYGANLQRDFIILEPLSLQVFPYTLKPPSNDAVNVTLIMDMAWLNSLTWALNKRPMAPFLELDEPLIFTDTNNTNLDSDLIPSYPVGSTVDVILLSNKVNPRHPVHKHGTKAWIIGSGDGDWSWPDVSSAQKVHPEWFNLENPPRRDGFFTHDAIRKTGWMVIRYTVTEPGVVFFHCHIASHAYGGMAVALMEGMDSATPLRIPDYYTAFDRMVAGQDHQAQS